MNPFAAWLRPARAARRLFSLVIVPALLAACSPAYDWREVRGPDDGYIAMLPAKPARMTRPINLDGTKVSMTMQGARVDEVAFTVAEAKLPDDRVETREQAVNAMRLGMVRNIDGRELKAQAVAVPVVESGSGKRVGTAPGWQIEAAGSAQGRPVELLAIFASRGSQVWQAVVLGPALDREQARQFFEGFRLVE